MWFVQWHNNIHIYEKVSSAPSTPKQESANGELSQENDKNDLALDDETTGKDAIADGML